MSEKFKFTFSNNESQIINNQTFEEVCYSGNKWVNYGKDNLYPEYLWGLYLNSSTHSSIIDQKVDYIMGEGFESGNREKKKIFKKIIFDQVLYGGFALQLIFDGLNRISKVNVLDFARCRVNKDLTKVYYSTKWTRNGGKPVEYDIYDPTTNETKPKTTEIYYFRGDKTRSIYPIPSYVGSTQSIETSIEIQNYHLSSIKNGFSPSAIINIVGDPSDEEKEQFDNDLNENFTGSSNASKYLIMYNENKDDATSIVRLESDKSDEKFKSLNEDVRNNIFIGHRIISPALIGLPINTGFSPVEYNDMFKLFNRTVISPIQNTINEVLTEIYGVEEIIIPFTITFDTVEKPVTYKIEPNK